MTSSPSPGSVVTTTKGGFRPPVQMDGRAQRLQQSLQEMLDSTEDHFKELCNFPDMPAKTKQEQTALKQAMKQHAKSFSKYQAQINAKIKQLENSSNKILFAEQLDELNMRLQTVQHGEKIAKLFSNNMFSRADLMEDMDKCCELNIKLPLACDLIGFRASAEEALFNLKYTDMCKVLMSNSCEASN